MINKPLMWAKDVKANVKEPIEILKQQGWQYGDVPTASNFNWLFKKITEDINTINQEVVKVKDSFTKDIANLQEKADILYKSTKVLEFFINKSLRNDHFNHGISKQICDLLRELEKQIKVFYPKYEPMPWPLSNHDNIPEPYKDELENIVDNIDKVENIISMEKNKS